MSLKSDSKLSALNQKIDDAVSRSGIRFLSFRYRSEEVWLLCSFYHESLRTWIKTIVTKFAISSHTALLLGVHALRRYLKLIVNMSFIAYQIKKLVAQRIMVKTASMSDRPWSTIFFVIVYSSMGSMSHYLDTMLVPVLQNLTPFSDPA